MVNVYKGQKSPSSEKAYMFFTKRQASTRVFTVVELDKPTMRCRLCKTTCCIGHQLLISTLVTDSQCVSKSYRKIPPNLKKV